MAEQAQSASDIFAEIRASREADEPEDQPEDQPEPTSAADIFKQIRAQHADAPPVIEQPQPQPSPVPFAEEQEVVSWFDKVKTFAANTSLVAYQNRMPEDYADMADSGANSRIAQYMMGDRWPKLKKDTKRLIGGYMRHTLSSFMEYVESLPVQPHFTAQLGDIPQTAISDTSLTMADKNVEEWRAAGKALIEETPELKDPTLMEQAFTTSMASISVGIPAMMVALATRGGALVGGALFGVTEMARQYSEDLSVGVTKDRAFAHALRSGILEGVGESVPFGQIMKLLRGIGAGSLAKRFAIWMGTELITEEATELGQLLNDWMSGMRPEPTAEEVKDLVALVAVSTVMTAGIQGGGVLGVRYSADSIKRLHRNLKGKKTLRAVVSDMRNLWDELDVPDRSAVGKYTDEQAARRLVPMMRSLLRIAEADPQLGEDIGLDKEGIARLKGKLVQLEKLPLKKYPRAIPETDVTPEGKVVLRGEDEVIGELEELVPEDTGRGTGSVERFHASMDELFADDELVPEDTGQTPVQTRVDNIALTEDAPTAVKMFSKAELQEAAESLGLPTTGNKRQIVERVQQHVKEQQPAEESTIVKLARNVLRQSKQDRYRSDLEARGIFDSVLHNSYSKADLQELAKTFGVSKSGTKEKIAGRIAAKAEEVIQEAGVSSAEFMGKPVFDTTGASFIERRIQQFEKEWDAAFRATLAIQNEMQLAEEELRVAERMAEATAKEKQEMAFEFRREIKKLKRHLETEGAPDMARGFENNIKFYQRMLKLQKTFDEDTLATAEKKAILARTQFSTSKAIIDRINQLHSGLAYNDKDTDPAVRKAYRDILDREQEDIGSLTGEVIPQRSWMDWMPFKTIFEYRSEGGAKTLPFDGSGQTKAAMILNRLPSIYISMLDVIGYMEGGHPDVAGQYVRASKTARVKRESLLSEEGPMYLTHEVGHGVAMWDSGEYGATITMESPYYDIRFEDNYYGPLMAEAIKAWESGKLLIGLIENSTGMGWGAGLNVDVVREYMDTLGWKQDLRNSAEIFMELNYPFGYILRAKREALKLFEDLKAGKTGKMLGPDVKLASFFQEELFAQTFAMYYYMNDVLSAVMPNTARTMEQIDAAGRASSTRGEANSRLRRILRAPGAAVRVEELSEFTGDFAASVKKKPTSSGLQRPQAKSRRNRRNSFLGTRARLKAGEPLIPAGQRAFEWLGSTLFRWAKPMGNVPDVAELLNERGLTQGQQAKIEAVERHFFDIFHGLDEDLGYSIVQYLTTPGAKVEDYLDEAILVRDKRQERRDRARGYKRRRFLPNFKSAKDRLLKHRYVSLAKKAKAAKRLILGIGKQLVRMQLLDREVYEKNADAYLPNAYLKYLLGETGVQQVSVHGKMDLKYLKHRKDLTRWEKDILYGRVSDPALLIPMTVGRTLRDITLYRYMERIKENENWVSQATMIPYEIPGEFHTEADPEGNWAAGDPIVMNVTPQWLKIEGERILSLIKSYPKRHQTEARAGARSMIQIANHVLTAEGNTFTTEGFVMLPDTATFGVLRGAWVRKEIANDLRGAMQVEISDLNGFLHKMLDFKTLAAVQSTWKLNKVALNPPTVARNVQSNLIMMNIFAGMPLFLPGKYNALKMFFTDAIDEILGNGKHHRIMLKHGATKSTFMDAEFLKIRRQFEGYTKHTNWAGAKFIEIAHKMARHIAEAGGNSYQTIELLGKISIVKFAMEKKGMSEAEAVALAQEALFDYSLVPAWVELLRKYPMGWPFITFQYKAVAKLTETFFANPHRYLPWVSTYFGYKLAAITFGDWEDEEEVEKAVASLPEYLRDNPGMLPFPFKDEEGLIKFFDISYIFPWSMPFSVWNQVRALDPIAATKELGLGGFWADLVIAAGSGRHPFYGTKIFEEGDSGAVKLAKSMEFVWNLWAPGIATSEPSNPPVKFVEALKGEPDLRGNPPPTKGDAFARMFGWNLYRIDPELSSAKVLSMMNTRINEFQQSVMAKIMRERDPATREELKQYMVLRILSMVKDMAQYQLETGRITQDQADRMLQKTQARIDKINTEEQ